MNKESTWLPTNKDIEDFKLLKGMLISQKKELDILSKKKADGQLNTMKIKMTNRVLEQLKELLKNESSHDFLDILAEDDMPTNSDAVLIFSQYQTAIEEFESKYYKRDRYIGEWRWITQEYPPEYYNEEEE